MRTTAEIQAAIREMDARLKTAEALGAYWDEPRFYAEKRALQRELADVASARATRGAA